MVYRKLNNKICQLNKDINILKISIVYVVYVLFVRINSKSTKQIFGLEWDSVTDRKNVGKDEIDDTQYVVKENNIKKLVSGN